MLRDGVEPGQIKNYTFDRGLCGPYACIRMRRDNSISEKSAFDEKYFGEKVNSIRKSPFTKGNCFEFLKTLHVDIK